MCPCEIETRSSEMSGTLGFRPQLGQARDGRSSHGFIAVDGPDVVQQLDGRRTADPTQYTHRPETKTPRSRAASMSKEKFRMPVVTRSFRLGKASIRDFGNAVRSRMPMTTSKRSKRQTIQYSLSNSVIARLITGGNSS